MAAVGGDGWPAEKVFEAAPQGYDYDDLSLMPGQVSFEASEVDVAGKLTHKIALRTPFVGVGDPSAHEAAVALALAGGIGIILSGGESVEAQAAAVRSVKRHSSGFLLEPPTLSPEHTLADLDRLQKERGTGFACVTETGCVGDRLVGLVGSRAADAVEDRSVTLESVMATRLVTGQEPLSLQQAMDKLRSAKVGKLPIVDSDGNLTSLVCRADLMQLRRYPLMSRDLDGRLLVGAAVDPCDPDAWDRVCTLHGVGTDVILLHLRGSPGEAASELARRIRAECPRCEVLAGPVGSSRDAKRLLHAGVGGILTDGGAFPSEDPDEGALGAVCRAEATSVYELAKQAAVHRGCPVVAGGAVRNSGQALKAFALGASSVLLGDALRGPGEAPGPGCKDAPAELAMYLSCGVRNGMQDLGTRSLVELHAALRSGHLRMECRTAMSAQARMACAAPAPLAA